jgi:hypothetical protein
VTASFDQQVPERMHYGRDYYEQKGKRRHSALFGLVISVIMEGLWLRNIEIKRG